jgi:hypothetical protein
MFAPFDHIPSAHDAVSAARGRAGSDKPAQKRTIERLQTGEMVSAIGK